MKKAVFSHIQAKILLQSREDGLEQVQISTDLGLTTELILLEDDGIQMSHGRNLKWALVEEIASSTNNCFEIINGLLDKIIAYSEFTERFYSLYPTMGAPTMLISGIPMHRIKNTDPYNDTQEKIKALKPVSGQVLDTATGLGYTAIQAARTAENVVTIEYDPVALEIAQRNPWSQDLFDNPTISQRIGDSYNLVKEFTDKRFSCILHDPPAFNLAGQLYASEFYVQLLRILKPKGRLFHYIGNPESKSGRSITRGVRERLRNAGFSRIIDRPSAFGLLAIK
jgi:predicted methyltransferase